MRCAFCVICVLNASRQALPAEDDSFFMIDNIGNDLRSLMSARIFFGHQSVGQNIVDGIDELLSRHGLPSDYIISADQPPPSGKGFLWHRPVGKNMHPISKCEDFTRILNHPMARDIDFALCKFCYIDINEHSNITDLFKRYQQHMKLLKVRHPDIRFIHTTVPLRHNATGPGVWFRELLGRANRSKLANINRNRFNRLLVEEYTNEPIFDLAASESTCPDGRRSSFTYKNRDIYYSLAGEYTDDGGHLNNTGRIKVAEDLIRYLARLYRAPWPNRTT